MRLSFAPLCFIIHIIDGCGMIDLLKLTDETDLDILNRSMEVLVEAFQTELLPVAAQLTARLVGPLCFLGALAGD